MAISQIQTAATEWYSVPGRTFPVYIHERNSPVVLDVPPANQQEEYGKLAKIFADFLNDNKLVDPDTVLIPNYREDGVFVEKVCKALGGVTPCYSDSASISLKDKHVVVLCPVFNNTCSNLESVIIGKGVKKIDLVVGLDAQLQYELNEVPNLEWLKLHGHITPGCIVKRDGRKPYPLGVPCNTHTILTRSAINFDPV